VLGARAILPGAHLTLSTFLPHLAGLRLDQVRLDGDTILLHLTPTARTARCPVCSRRSRRVQSFYHRTVADLPICGRRLLLRLRVRRFRCDARRCPRAIFAERFPRLVAVRGRRTRGQCAALEAIGFALGGAAGARLAARLGSPASRATLLRLIRGAALADRPTPRVLGVDDWAFRKGHRYGTILVDLERHTVIELLPERKAEPVAEWLQEHPGVEVFSRDRAPAYAEAARKGAPDAVQVADRWHLLRNLVEALERCLLRHSAALKVAAGTAAAAVGPLPSYADAERVPWQQRAEAASRQQHAGKVEQYEQMRALAAAGFTKLDIAQLVGVSRPTVYRYLALEAPPERRRPQRSGRGVLEPYEPYLRRRWAEGCRNRARLFREVRLLGYRHSARTVYHFCKRLERDEPGSTAAPARPTTRVPSARHVACLLVRRPDAVSEEERDYLSRLCQRAPTLATAYELAQEFAELARERQGQVFAAWLTKATISGIAELRGFAAGLLDDRAAVEAGLSLEWSNGQTEGQVNKLKLLKRQMYGRASFDLLRRRVLRAV
jgi:transposase